MYDLISEFEVYLREKDASPFTVRAYLSHLKKFIKWYRDTAGELPETGVVGPLDIAEFKRHLQNQNQKPATINRALRSLKIIFFKWAVEKGCIAQNPAGDIKPVSEVKSAPRALGRYVTAT
ncbi:Tyrosine recombinase XerC [Koleobacter methoxysyntrophicus]|uniref:Tyrosine recombinase XerC n=1 Tax=Koleobacter methoxysyntrophicus TaxID=2751313 RepID=A0A8A0RQ60_9FIRM|nr:phage integrase N-terminal SAM-like domain-containing protein [Koleobacter methoxysyntrophicus]QSQ10511.1 Tyrosine recombinase XerC [Koleobacter methoxysyntrophicus]